MKSYMKLFLAALATAGMLSACNKDEQTGGGSSTEGFFFINSLSYNLLENPEINIPVVRLGFSGDLTVNVSSTGDPEFNVPSSVTIKDGDRAGFLAVTYDKGALQFNKRYKLSLNISGFTSAFGYEKADVTIEWPTAYFKYGEGGIDEGWWAEHEEKTLFVREFSENVYQCYLPDCWGHDTGPDYDVQDYVFYWNTATNKVYIPFQYMGYRWIGDLGSVACKFGGPDYEEGSADWMAYIDNYYKGASVDQPHFVPETNTFYLSDTGSCTQDGQHSGPTTPDKLILQ